jgi:hypothetical protein
MNKKLTMTITKLAAIAMIATTIITVLAGIGAVLSSQQAYAYSCQIFMDGQPRDSNCSSDNSFGQANTGNANVHFQNLK